MQNTLPVLTQHHFSLINASGTTFTIPKFSNKMLSQTLHAVCHACTIIGDGSVVKVFFCMCTRSLGTNHFIYSTNFILADFISSKNMTTYLQKQLKQGEAKNETKPNQTIYLTLCIIHPHTLVKQPSNADRSSLSFLPHSVRKPDTQNTLTPARSVRG